ncbi:MAG: hypothetical protein GXO87_12150 [Chlorobi bacterium]|nr:hypothetical protein [Chlorobiota bacterium]
MRRKPIQFLEPNFGRCFFNALARMGALAGMKPAATRCPAKRDEAGRLIVVLCALGIMNVEL